MKRIPLTLSLLLVLAARLCAVDIIDLGEAPAEWTAAPKNTALGQKLLSYTTDGPIPLDQGRILFNSRLRVEHAAQQGLQSDLAWTWRTRIGYETPKYYGIYGVGEFENTWAMNLSNYQSTPPPLSSPNNRAVIADPRNNQLNQLFLGYSGYNSAFKGGRQIVNLNNQRFVGAVAWRQNDQTYDAVRAETEIVKDFWISYVYNWQVNRVFGVYAPVTEQERFISRNHFVNVNYLDAPYGTAGAYFYYLDLGDGLAARNGSGSSAGVFYDGSYEIDENWSLPFRAEYAFQVNNGASAPVQGNFFENYWHIILGAKYQNYELDLGFENLSGNGTRSFQTPLGTLHGFNGWADRFLVTPLTGLRDYYLRYNIGLPYEVKLTGALHYFTAEQSDNTYGKEIDIGFSRKFSENLSGMVKFAYYDGNGSPNVGLAANTTKLWMQLDFSL